MAKKQPKDDTAVDLTARLEAVEARLEAIELKLNQQAHAGSTDERLDRLESRVFTKEST